MLTLESPENFGNTSIHPGAATLTQAPGSSEWEDVQGLLTFAQKLEKRNRESLLLLGAVFSELKQLYRNYSKALYKAGFRKDEIMTYQQFKAESGFSIPSQASISNYTRVWDCYCISYQMAQLERRGHEMTFSRLDPLLLASPFDMLVYLLREGYHNTAARAREILYNLQPHIMKRSDFWLWLEQQPRVTPPAPSSLVDAATPFDKPYQDKIEEIYEPYELADPAFDWNKLAGRVKIPQGIKRPIRITVMFSEVEYGRPNP